MIDADMNKRLLLIGPNFHDFNKYVLKAFQELGWNVVLQSYDTPVHPFSSFNKIRYKLTSNKASLIESSRKAFSSGIAKKYKELSPELVFVLNGEMLSRDVVQTMRQSSKVVLWLFDSITRLPYCWEMLPCYDKVFCYEKDDIQLIKDKLSIEAEFLPQAVDPSAYHPLGDPNKKWDIVFAADLWKSERRKYLIQKVVAAFPDRKIRIWGIYKPWYKGLWKCLTRERKDVYTNRNASTEQLNLDYNGAEVVLNIHHEQQRNGANPKVYEIAASGSYQICDANPYIETLFPHGEIGLYHDEAELMEQIRWALDPVNKEMKDRKAREAMAMVCAAHTFKHRMQFVLETVGL